MSVSKPSEWRRAPHDAVHVIEAKLVLRSVHTHSEPALAQRPQARTQDGESVFEKAASPLSRVVGSILESINFTVLSAHPARDDGSTRQAPDGDNRRPRLGPECYRRAPVPRISHSGSMLRVRCS